MATIKSLVALTLILFSALLFAHGEDDPLLTKLMIDQFEMREDDAVILEADLWLGKDLHKVWFKTDAEMIDGETEDAELQAVFSRAISPYWDIQVGWRHDFELDFSEDKNWLAVGVRGLASYFFDIDAALYIGDGGDTALRLQAEYELLITQRWQLIPEIEINIYGQDIEVRGIGSGVADAELGLRLAYYPRREFAPYLGYNWERLYGDTANYAELAGEENKQSTWVVGFTFWY